MIILQRPTGLGFSLKKMGYNILQATEKLKAFDFWFFLMYNNIIRLVI